MTKKLIIILSAVLFLVACGNTNNKAKALLDEARLALDERRYDDVLAKIDTLRNKYPRAIEERKQALPLWQKAELLRTQDELAVVDSLLAVVESAYNEVRQLQNQADKSGDQEAWKRHNRTANQLKARKDSLQNRFDEACAKIKYIHKKQKEI